MGVVEKPQLSILAAELNDQERKLCEVLVSNPGIQFKEAGIKAGYSPKAAGPCVTRALKRPEVQAYLQAFKGAVDNPGEKKIRRKVMKAREVLWRLSQIGRASMKPHLDIRDGEVVGTKIDPEHADTLREVTFTRKSGGEGDHSWSEDTVRAKVADPLPALQTLAKYHGLEKSAPASNVTVNILAVQEKLKQVPTAELRTLQRLLLEAENGEGEE